MLSGKPPFDGETDEEILRNVQKGVYKMSGPIWSRVSAEGVDLVKKMLCFDDDRRITAQQALHHEWIINNTDATLLEEVIHSDALKNLKDFNS